MIFPELAEILERQQELIEAFGGRHGWRDEGALQSALLAVENRHYYEDLDDVAALAATYAYHLVKAHAFLDGNKRIAAYVATAFVYANRGELEVTDDALVDVFTRLAAGELTRDEVENYFQLWFREIENR